MAFCYGNIGGLISGTIMEAAKSRTELNTGTGTSISDVNLASCTQSVPITPSTTTTKRNEEEETI